MPSATTRARTAFSHESCRSNPAAQDDLVARSRDGRGHHQAATREVARRRADHHGHDCGREGARAGARDPDLEGWAHRAGGSYGLAGRAAGLACRGVRRARLHLVDVPVACPGHLAVHGVLRYWSVPELVALDLPGGVGFVDALRAIWDTGDAAAPLDPRLPGVARRAMLDALRPTRIVASDGEQHALPDGLPAEEGDALVITTSGTSGQPKGVVLTHEAVAASAPCDHRATGRRPGAPLVAGLPATGAHRRPVGRDAGHHHRYARAGAARLRSGHGRSGGRAPDARRTSRSWQPRYAGWTPPSSPACCSVAAKPPDVLPSNVVSTFGMTETGSGVVYDGTPLDGVDLALRPSEGTAWRDGGRDGRAGRTRAERSSSARRCCSAVTATGPTGGSWDPTARPTGSPPATPGISIPTGR